MQENKSKEGKTEIVRGEQEENRNREKRKK